jgi:hypothetical protein
MERLERTNPDGWKSKPLSRIVSREKAVYEMALEIFKWIRHESFRREDAIKLVYHNYPYQKAYSFIPRLYEDGVLEKKPDETCKRVLFKYRFSPGGINFVQEAIKIPKGSILKRK